MSPCQLRISIVALLFLAFGFLGHSNAFSTIALPFSAVKSQTLLHLSQPSLQPQSASSQPIPFPLSIDVSQLSGFRSPPATREISPSTVPIINPSEPDSETKPLSEDQPAEPFQEEPTRRRPGRPKSLKAKAGELSNRLLLRKNEEVVLGREIQKQMSYERVLSKLQLHLGRKPSYSEWASAIREGMTVLDLKKQLLRSTNAKTALIHHNTRLVGAVAQAYTKRYKVNPQDLFQQGIIGLTRACEGFDPEKGFKFSTYAMYWIRLSMAKVVAEQKEFMHISSTNHGALTSMHKYNRLLKEELGRDATVEEVSESTGMDVDKLSDLKRLTKPVISSNTNMYNPKDGSDSGSMKMIDTVGVEAVESPNADSSAMKFALSKVVYMLNSREQIVVRMRYGLDAPAKTLGEISQILRISRERVRQLESQALAKLEDIMRERFTSMLG